jgi:integrase
MALNWAVKDRLIAYNPILSVLPLKEQAPKKVMLDDGTENGPEWQKLYNAAATPTRGKLKKNFKNQQSKLQQLIFLQYKTGMRQSEVCGLRWSYVDLIAKVIRLPASATKNGLPRVIPLYDEVVQMLSEISKEHENVFWGRGDRPLLSYEKAFCRAVEDAGLPKSITTHALRRTRLQIWDRVSIDLSCSAGGHQDKRVHQKHYTEAKPDMLQALVKAS